jgi:hypothetical protein
MRKTGSGRAAPARKCRKKSRRQAANPGRPAAKRELPQVCRCNPAVSGKIGAHTIILRKVQPWIFLPRLTALP